MKSRLFCVIALSVSAICLPRPAVGDQTALQLPDILAWKRIQTPVVSNDGHWFAYKLVPNDGNAEVVLKNLQDGKEQRFSMGEVQRPNPYAGGGGPPQMMGPPHDIAFSDDSKWLAFEEHPSQKAGKLLTKQHKPLENNVLVVELATGKKTEFDRIKRFSFSGERSSAIALHRYPPAPAGPAGAVGNPATAGGVATKPDDKPQGSDLILLELASGNELSLGNVSDFAFDKKGDWLAWLVDAQDKLGNGIELRNMMNGTVVPLDSGKATYKSLNWTEKGDGLAAVRGMDDKRWEDKLYTLLAFKGFGDGSAPQKFVYDPAKDQSFPSGMTISAERKPAWMADLSVVTFGIHEVKPKERKDHEQSGREASADGKPNNPEDQPDLVIWHWKDSRLQSMQQVQENRDKNFSFLCAWDPSSQKFSRLADPSVRDVSATPEAKYALGIDIRGYELESNLDGQRYQDIYKGQFEERRASISSS